MHLVWLIKFFFEFQFLSMQTFRVNGQFGFQPIVFCLFFFFAGKKRGDALFDVVFVEYGIKSMRSLSTEQTQFLAAKDKGEITREEN